MYTRETEAGDREASHLCPYQHRKSSLSSDGAVSPMPLPRQTRPSCGGFQMLLFAQQKLCWGHRCPEPAWSVVSALVSLPCTQCWPSLSLALLASVERTVPLSSWSGSRFFQRVLRPLLVPDTHRSSKHVSTSYTPGLQRRVLSGSLGWGVPSVSQTMPGDMVHSPVDFAESLHVPVFVSCRPQGPGLGAGWFQDKHFFLPLVEGWVGVMGRDMPKVTLTRL